MRLQDPIINISRSSWRAIGSMILVAILILFFLSIITVYARRPDLSDFLNFYASARFLWEGQSTYTPDTLDTISSAPNIEPDLLITSIHPNINPPMQTLLISHLGLLSYRSAFWIWSLISFNLGLDNDEAGRVADIISIADSYCPKL